MPMQHTMDGERASAGTPAQLAKGALRRLAQARLEPTPANFARAYAEEAGQAPPVSADDAPPPARARAVLERLAMRASDDAAQRGHLLASLTAGRWDEAQHTLEYVQAHQPTQPAQPNWTQLLERLTRGLERGGRHWTSGRKKESLQRLLDNPRQDSARLAQRLQQMLVQWETDQPDAGVQTLAAAVAAAVAPQASGAAEIPETAVPTANGASLHPDPHPGHHPQMVASLAATVQAGLGQQEARASALADELDRLARRIATEGATIQLAEAVAELCLRARCLFGLRQELADELLGLTRSLTEGIGELAEDASWAEGQAAQLREQLQGPTNARAVRAARTLLGHARAQQQHLRRERQDARDALKQVVQQVLSELGSLDNTTGAFNTKLQAHAQAIESAESLESLNAVVRDLVNDSRAVHTVVSGARERLASEHAKASALETKVREMEAELRRLSDELGTDVLTQVANRRGLIKVFEQERARVARDGQSESPLAVGLIDIDNFKKLNDTLGHAAGDVALKSLAQRVKEWLRPVDHVARFGGEEFVVLLPGTPVDEAQQVLTRLQRQLTASLFMHDGKEVFVTFSAGVTRYRIDEALELALERADEALYEAKRTGKNRTCIA